MDRIIHVAVVFLLVAVVHVTAEALCARPLYGYDDGYPIPSPTLWPLFVLVPIAQIALTSSMKNGATWTWFAVVCAAAIFSRAASIVTLWPLWDTMAYSEFKAYIGAHVAGFILVAIASYGIVRQEQFLGK